VFYDFGRSRDQPAAALDYVQRGTVNQIRALVAELPTRPALELALAILLALLDREPDTWPRAAAPWGSRFTLERNLTLPDAQLMLAALAVLPGAGGRGGAEALIDLADRSLGTSFVSDLPAVGCRRALPTYRQMRASESQPGRKLRLRREPRAENRREP
jgi:hypothetical protein